MDFWTRLIGGSGAQKRRSTANDPQQRLARFKRVYNQILQTWQKSAQLAGDWPALDSLRSHFQRLTAILNEESRSPAPHLCLTFAASSHIFSAISKIAATSHNEALVREAVGFFSALIDSEEEDFLANGRFAEALMSFISRIASSQSLVVGEDTDAEIVELLFGIAAKIRLEPELLPVWFSSTGKVDSDGGMVQQVGFAGVIRKEDFPLCYQLIDHVHHEGRIGDFARTGLLYIFETSSKSHDLEQWIVESDLATLMASGLGALYSQLSRKLSIVHPKDDLPIILQLSDYPEVEKAINDSENVFSEDFKLHMDTFLSYLAFWQDVLEHCRSPDVRQTLIDHFQVLFLQQLLYPSLFESSDVDGGSAVAVLNYLRRILDALDHPELVHMILRYLLALPDEQAGRPRSRSVKKRRSTLMLLSKPNDKEPELNPSLFNLVDLLLNCTQSRNHQTVASALKLVSTILSKNHKYATGTLVNVTEVHNKDPLRTVGALHAEIESYLDLAENMVPGSDINREYESFLKDVLNLLEAHPCSMKHLSLHGLNLPNQAAVDYLHAEIRKESTIHHLTAGDALFKSLMGILSNFFTNNVETNLNLTEAIVNLATCPNLRLEGWLAVEPTNYQFNPNENFDNEDEDLKDVFRARRKPKWTPHGAPALMVALNNLQEQIECLREQIPDFNQHVANRKQAFRVHEELNEAMRSTANFPPPTPLGPPKSSHGEAPTGPGSWTPQFQNMLEGTISPLRSQSPRGRAHTIQPTVRLSPAPKQPRLDAPSLSPSPHPSTSRSPVRGSARGVSPVKPPIVIPDPRRPSLTSTVLNDVNDAANAEILKKVIRFPLQMSEARKKKLQQQNLMDKALPALPKEQPLTEVAEENEGKAEGAKGEAEKDGAKVDRAADAATAADSGVEGAKKDAKDGDAPEAKSTDSAAAAAEPQQQQSNGATATESTSNGDTEAFPALEDEMLHSEPFPELPTEMPIDEMAAESNDVPDNSNTSNVTLNIPQHEHQSRRSRAPSWRWEEKKEDVDEIREATLGHVLTNVVILQEFVLEIIAILQVRASLFQEVRFV
ncbi:hypothetical protein DIS24_g8334 [Lasiodiplodia hormozganensis]|uniref:FHF complex subunit HOOK-interacting protein C-terminal domain-containing protein n=1 Tax=Lasiodiplodia hormozganensis TaxID=869390 RepID=A0AA39Y541_9PEZI|nr:hypothetical protein DIS24_g8334 [Lasiodiplodia hormozganensis]